MRIVALPEGFAHGGVPGSHVRRVRAGDGGGSVSATLLAAATERRSGASHAPSGPASGAVEPSEMVYQVSLDVAAATRRPECLGPNRVV